MNKYILRKMAALLLAGVFLTASLNTAASQTDKKLKDAGNKIDQLEEKKENAKERLGVLKEEEGGLKGKLSDLNGQLIDVSGQITDLETQIKEKKAAIEEAGRALKEAEATREEQYESMKLRIRYIYENGGIDTFAVLLGSSSLADLLNRAEYVEEINRYDRQMLKNYEGVCAQITREKQTMKTEKKELVAIRESMEQKEAEVEGLIAKVKDSLTATQSEISNTKEAVNGYDAQIAKMKAYEEELERKKEEEARKRAKEQQKAAEKQKPPEASGGGSVTANTSDVAMLAALVECEAGGESYEGQLAVASVVVNRVKSGSFPNTVSGVIYQGGQFSPVASGRFAVVLARGAAGSCTQAASAALSGNTNVGCYYFCRASSGVAGTVIGNHVFY